MDKTKIVDAVLMICLLGVGVVVYSLFPLIRELDRKLSRLERAFLWERARRHWQRAKCDTALPWNDFRELLDSATDESLSYQHKAENIQWLESYVDDRVKTIDTAKTMSSEELLHALLNGKPKGQPKPPFSVPSRGVPFQSPFRRVP